MDLISHLGNSAKAILCKFAGISTFSFHGGGGVCLEPPLLKNDYEYLPLEYNKTINLLCKIQSHNPGNNLNFINGYYKLIWLNCLQCTKILEFTRVLFGVNPHV